MWVLTLAHENVHAGIIFWQFTHCLPDQAFLAWLPRPLHESRGLLRVRLANMVGQRKTVASYTEIMKNFAFGIDKAAETARRILYEDTQKRS